MPCASSRSSRARRSSASAASTSPAAVAELGAQQPQREREHHQPLLGAVVQVALEPAALGVAGLDGARARGAQLLELRARLRLQPLVVERQPGGRADLLERARDRRADRRGARARRPAGRRAAAA